jgi:hypothetical protein
MAKKATKPEPHYAVQIADPKILRKDILEALREVIIFMQGYERFRAIQEEKVTIFNQLKADTKKLQTLIDTKLRRKLPKGKLSAVKPSIIVPVKEPGETPAATPAPAHIDDLENQLQDIEKQLQGMG